MSASTLATTNFTNSSDANFRAWGSFIDTAILAGGFVHTADAGQIDFTTVLAPVAINTSQGYKMYNSSDAGGGLSDYFVKLEFGSGANTLRPALWITYGWATNGAGGFDTTNFVSSARTQITTGVNPSGNSISINVAAGNSGIEKGYFCIAATSVTGAESLLCAVERTRTVAGVGQDQILAIGSQGGLFGINGFDNTISKLQVFPNVGNVLACAIPPNANTPIAGIVALGQVFGLAPGATNPSINVFGVESAALGVYQDTVSVNIGNPPVAHNYKIQRDLVFGGTASTVLLTRYE